MRRSAYAVFLLLVAISPRLSAQCAFSSTTYSCASGIQVGNGGICTMSKPVTGLSACTGGYNMQIGIEKAGTVDNPQSSHPFMNCTIMPQGTYGNTQLKSTVVCQGNGSVAPGQSLTLSVRVTPGEVPVFPDPNFGVFFSGTFQRSDNVGGTYSQSWSSILRLALANCTAIPTAPGAVASGTFYSVIWNSTSSTAGHEIQEATKPDFSDAVTFTEPTSISRSFQHNVTTPTTYYYRVRPVSCSLGTSFGPTAQTVVLPQQSPTSKEFDMVIPVGSGASATQDVRFGGLTPGASFAASTDKPYLTVAPNSGTVGSDGSVTVTVRGDSSGLGVGANTGTVLLTATTGKGSPVPNGTTTVSAPVSVSLVTPVSPVAKGAPPNDALIVPAVAHLEGIVPFRSDVRLTNAGSGLATYLLSFTPQNTDGTTSGRQTTITVQPDQTVALNDVLRDFFGFAQPTDAAGGVLDIRTQSGSATATYVSSRTFAATADGTYGQFIPAVPLSKFIKAGGGALTLTQVSQGTAFRTNLGLVGGLGFPASGKIRVFNPSGQNVGEFPFSLRSFEFQQLGSFLAANGLSLDDARIDVSVDSTTGGVTTYASVLDQKTQDPLLVSPIKAADVSANRYVLPGMADLDTPVSNFHSDIRVYNSSASSVSATLTYYPQGNPAAATTRAATLAPGEIRAYNNVLPTLFGVTATGGAIVVTTPNNVPFIVSGRTYSIDTSKGGTYGQFIPAVTPAEGIGLNDAPLQILQLEQSKNFRSNVGLNELTGNPVTIQVSAILPDSKVSPSTTVDLQGNEFRQLGSILASLNPGNNTYNGRVTVKVIAGTGRVTAYGSVVDNNTSDPTYIPAQK